ncbi:unnamed protein product [Cladocopium goreaui]|uniref:Uncharacterized protein n=1 Tax=Cladocopium goreaui TaxID=2562237 RepID=A0A9P1DGX5_9DINO|nr:unnamed protein product [Cladocopium goreaui]
MTGERACPTAKQAAHMAVADVAAGGISEEICTVSVGHDMTFSANGVWALTHRAWCAQLSAECVAAEAAYGVNFTALQVLSKRHFQGRAHDETKLRALIKETWPLASELLSQCPAAVLVSSALLMLTEMHRLDAIRTNWEHEQLFHRISRYERAMVDAGNRLQVISDDFWPLSSAWDLLLSMVDFIKEKVRAAQDLMSPASSSGPQITDEAHVQALEDVAAIMSSLGLEWWPCRGTLIALLRHGACSGVLAPSPGHPRRDVVDHDVDVMVGVPSEAAWSSTLRWLVDAQLRQRGWNACFGRYSVDASLDSFEIKLAREDLMLCTRKNPEMVLDLATYVRGNGPSVFAQRYCVPALPGDSGCYIPRAGTLRGGQGRLRSSAIRPLGRCKAGHISVPCPHKPLETLQATMPEVNFTRHCLALPDVVKRQQRGYLTDEPWLRSGLTLEDVEVLRRRAAQLDAEGYMSMTPYFGSCDLSNLPPQNVEERKQISVAADLAEAAVFEAEAPLLLRLQPGTLRFWEDVKPLARTCMMCCQGRSLGEVQGAVGSPI